MPQPAKENVMTETFRGVPSVPNIGNRNKQEVVAELKKKTEKIMGTDNLISEFVPVVMGGAAPATPRESETTTRKVGRCAYESTQRVVFAAGTDLAGIVSWVVAARESWHGQTFSAKYFKVVGTGEIVVIVTFFVDSGD